MGDRLIDILASRERLKAWLEADGCDTPGEKKRSKGKGRGLARGKGKGPMGKPGGGKKAKVEFGAED